MPPVSSPGIRATALVLVATMGCAATPAQVAIPNGGHDPAPLARCRIAADQKDPLVTEWPASTDVSPGPHCCFCVDAT